MRKAMNPPRTVLLQARKKYSECAKRIESRIATVGLTQVLSDQIVGVGVAGDWVRRAAEMEDVVYIGKQLERSSRKGAFVEVLRYTFAWFGINAVFSRPALLNLLGQPTTTSELSAFRVLYDSTTLPNATALQARLHSILAAQTSPRLPNVAPGTVVSTVHAIHTKYLSHHNKGLASQAVAQAAAGNFSQLTIPKLLYAFRNWSVHGNALEGSFGTRPGFITYVETLEEILAEVHLTTATRLFNVL
jgi:hypothetical protein